MLMSFNTRHTLLNSTKTLGKINNAFIEINRSLEGVEELHIVEMVVSMHVAM